MQSPPVLIDFQVSKILAQSIISIGRPHNNTCINASNVSSFNRLLRSLFTQSCLENLRLHITVLVNPKLQLAEPKLHSRNWKRYCNLEVSARVPRVESNYVNICKLQPLYFVTCISWRGLHWERWKLCRAQFCGV